MGARPFASGTVSFGLVSIPIRLFSAGESKAAVSFNLLHGKCSHRLKQQYVCPTCDEIVPRDKMVKGYEFSKDQYVTFSEDEIKALAEESQRAIEITEFVPEVAVDPIFFDRAYYVGPDEGGEKAYHLLLKAMLQSGRSAVAKWATRGKLHLVLIRPTAEGLVLQQLLHADEVRSITEIPLGEAEVKESELTLAIQLVEQIASEEFHPEAYEDEVKKRTLEAIQRKVEGQEITTAPERPRAQVIDLMEALKASLSGGATAAAEDERKPAKRAEPQAARGPQRVAAARRARG